MFILDNMDFQLKRLTRLVGTDPGFYTLALHSFIEAYVCEKHRPCGNYPTFPEKMEEFKNFLGADISRKQSGLLVRLQKEHALTNAVRHKFYPLRNEEVTQATYNFLSFCGLCGIDSSDSLAILEKNLDAWKDKTSPLDTRKAFKDIKWKLFQAERQNKELLDQLPAYKAKEEELAHLQARLKAVEKELETTRDGADSQKDKVRIKELREERHSLKNGLQEANKKLEQFANLQEYIDYSSRFTNYTRTRQDYERSVLKLTSEQQQVLSAIKPDNHFLIRGAAGTGKTLVLLEALKKIGKSEDGKLSFSERGTTVFLTYTTTLAKYDAYLAEIMHTSGGETRIMTLDSFILTYVRAVNPALSVDFPGNMLKTLCKEHNTTSFFRDEELYTELENFIYANNITEAEYIDMRIPRKGMRTPLNNSQRMEVWEIKKKIEKGMKESYLSLPRNYSRLTILNKMNENPDDPIFNGIDYIFLDETQDLTAVDLMVLRSLAKKALIMAGDTGQTIYSCSSPYARADVAIAGRTRILKTNFRNTVEIHKLSEAYRLKAIEQNAEEPAVSTAFREGPPPELYTADSAATLKDLLIRKVMFFIDTIGYDPENIAILAPFKHNLEAFKEILSAKDIQSEIINDKNFQFTTGNILRLSTLHSSKGMDFPVVLLYLPTVLHPSDYDTESTKMMQRNLLYVAMTRAMDNLSIFMKENPEEQVLQEFRGIYDEYRRGAEVEITGK